MQLSMAFSLRLWKGEQEDGGEKGEGNDRRDGEGEWDRGHGVF